MAEPPVVIIGAGPAGLAAARELRVRRVPFRLLERGDTVGYSWSRLYDSLRLHTGKHLSGLPGLRFPRSAPLFPTRLDFLEYLARYSVAYDLVPELASEVVRVRRNGRWLVETAAQRIEARAVVVATGIIAGPHVPAIPKRDAFTGRVLHSIEYRRPEPFRGRRVLIVGVGNSGGEIGTELARSGIDTTMAVRSGAHVVPLTVLGLPIQYLSVYVRRLPRPAQEAVVSAVRRISESRRGPPVLPLPSHSPLDAIPLIGFHLVDEIRAGRVALRPGIEHFTRTGMRFTDGSEEPFDDTILATGFRAALAPLGDAVTRDPRGFALRSDRVRSADQPDLYFIGHNYDAAGGLRNITHDAPLIAEHLTR